MELIYTLTFAFCIFPMMRPRNTNAIFIRAFILVAAVLVLWRLGAIIETFRALSLAVASPFWQMEGALAEKLIATPRFFSSKKYLSKEVRDLREENAFLKARLSFEALIAEENRELKEILGMRQPKTDSLLAVVLSRPGRSPYDMFVIDGGSNAGIQAGNVAVAYGNISIGVIERVHAGASIARLFSSPGGKISAFLGAANTPIQAEGEGGGSFRATVPKDIMVARGDQVTISSADAPFLGIVEEIHTAPSDSFQEILFRTPVNIYTLKRVEVLLGTSYPPMDGREE